MKNQLILLQLVIFNILILVYYFIKKDWKMVNAVKNNYYIIRILQEDIAKGILINNLHWKNCLMY